MRNQLPCFSASSTKAHTVNHIIQTRLKQLQEILTGCALQTGRFEIIVSELPLKNAVNATNFLLLTVLNTEVGQPTTTLTMLTGRSIDFALGFKGTNAAFKEQICAFATCKFAGGSNITSHDSASYTRRFL